MRKEGDEMDFDNGQTNSNSSLLFLLAGSIYLALAAAAFVWYLKMVPWNIIPSS